MGKFGVGVGDDFPVDDGRGNAGGGDQGPTDPPRDDRAEYEEWKRRREEWRAQREHWRRQRDEWRARKRAFKEKVRQAARENFGRDWDEYRDRRDGYYGRSHRFPFFLWPLIGLLIPILIVAMLISLVAAIFKSPFLFLGLCSLAFAFFVWKHDRRRHFYYGPYREYDFDLKPSNGPSQPPQPGPVVTPPPSSNSESGK